MRLNSKIKRARFRVQIPYSINISIKFLLNNKKNKSFQQNFDIGVLVY